MNSKPEFDIQAAHKYFSAHCFNTAWEFIDKKDRTADDDERMMRLAETSLWHWQQRDDRKDQNLSVGYWQLSRVYALARRPEEALKYGKLSLDYSQNEEPFYRGYAYEALARAEAAGGNMDNAGRYINEAKRLSEQISDPEWKKMLDNDLANII